MVNGYFDVLENQRFVVVSGGFVSLLQK